MAERQTAASSAVVAVAGSESESVSESLTMATVTVTVTATATATTATTTAATTTAATTTAATTKAIDIAPISSCLIITLTERDIILLIKGKNIGGNFVNVEQQHIGNIHYQQFLDMIVRNTSSDRYDQHPQAIHNIMETIHFNGGRFIQPYNYNKNKNNDDDDDDDDDDADDDDDDDDDTNTTDRGVAAALWCTIIDRDVIKNEILHALQNSRMKHNHRISGAGVLPAVPMVGTTTAAITGAGGRGGTSSSSSLSPPQVVHTSCTRPGAITRHRADAHHPRQHNLTKNDRTAITAATATAAATNTEANAVLIAADAAADANNKRKHCEDNPTDTDNKRKLIRMVVDQDNMRTCATSPSMNDHTSSLATTSIKTTVPETDTPNSNDLANTTTTITATAATMDGDKEDHTKNHGDDDHNGNSYDEEGNNPGANVRIENAVDKSKTTQTVAAAETALLVRVAEAKETARLAAKEEQRIQEEEAAAAAAAEEARLVRVAEKKEATRLAAEEEQRKQEEEGKKARDDFEVDAGVSDGDDIEPEKEGEQSTVDESQGASKWMQIPLLKFLYGFLEFACDIRNVHFLGNLRQLQKKYLKKKKKKKKPKYPLKSDISDYVEVAYAFGGLIGSLGEDFNGNPDEALSNKILKFLQQRVKIKKTGDVVIHWRKGARVILSIIIDVLMKTTCSPDSMPVHLALSLPLDKNKVIGEFTEGRLEDSKGIKTITLIQENSDKFLYSIESYGQHNFEVDKLLCRNNNGEFFVFQNTIENTHKEFHEKKYSLLKSDDDDDEVHGLNFEGVNKYLDDHECSIIMLLYTVTEKEITGALTRSQTKGNRTETTTTVDSFMNDVAKRNRTETTTTVDSFENGVELCLPFATSIILNTSNRRQKNGKPYSLEVVSNQMRACDGRGYHALESARGVLEENNLVLTQLNIGEGELTKFFSLMTGIYMFVTGHYGEGECTNKALTKLNRHVGVYNAEKRMVVDRTNPFLLDPGVEKEKEKIKAAFEKNWGNNGNYRLVKCYIVIDMNNLKIPEEVVPQLKQGSIPTCVLPLIKNQIREWEQIRRIELSEMKKGSLVPKCKYCTHRHREVCLRVAEFVSTSRAVVGPAQDSSQRSPPSPLLIPLPIFSQKPLKQTCDPTQGLSSTSSLSSLAKSSDSGSGLEPKSVLEGRVEEGGDAKFVSNHGSAVAVGVSSPVGTTAYVPLRQLTGLDALLIGYENSSSEEDNSNDDDY